MAIAAMNEDMFTEDVIADPYAYYGRLREDDPVHWNTQVCSVGDHPSR